MSNVSVSSLIVLSSMMMLQLLTPYWMVATLLFQTLMVGILLSLLGNSLWFSYILFLVFMGGVLVIFSYMSSLVSEELMESIPFRDSLMGGILVLFTSGVMSSLELSSISPAEGVLWNKNIVKMMSEMFSTGSMLMYSFVVSYLLLALFCVANMAKSKLGPLRLLK